MRTDRGVAAPHHAQGFAAEGTSGRPLRTTFRAFMKQRLCPAERLSHLLQIKDETARGVATNKKVFHGPGLPCRAHLGGVRWNMSIALYTSVVLRKRCTESEGQAECGRRSSLNELVADRVENEVAEGMKIELEHDSGAVALNRSCADQQLRACFSVRLADGEKRDDLAFARR
jgi:hypothetical protein